MTALTRRGLLAGAAALVLPLPTFAQARKYDLQPFEIADGVWMIEGRREVFTRENGGDIVNVALLATEAGALVFDSGSTAAMGAEIRAFADQRLGGLAATINTHHHPDHWFGNAPLADRPVLALAATAATCREYAQDYAETLYSILGSWISATKAVPATGSVEAGARAFGGRALRMIPLAGHTAADLAIMDEATGVLIAGDLVFLDRAPSLPDADFATWLAALDQLEGLGAAGVVPGHGPFHRAGEGIAQTRAYLRATRDRLAMAADLGLTAIEAMAAGPVPEFAGLGANPEEYLRSVVRRFGDHETGALPVVGGA
ncbi:quinoprotein relay system zinc metallohydrolase 1 [Paracoccus sp. TOH]|uniref:quinoprotein relay system zinc metallohydrolase 1 n=1 Tax=Paracoccus sp. TOH TaxID=1263728 RepID=UPI0025AF7672|nr:quinoprotein relay system zinc metallohydrolase 1 [Paracoccus sp. TOH]WJS86617.1 quinoprotein relay system zinc metallohydrolase 1 [Paracoccus sp. TOH]